MLNFKHLKNCLKIDKQRLFELYESRQQKPPPLLLNSSLLCVFLYRLSHGLFKGGHSFLARMVWQLNVVLTGADISQGSDIAPGFVVLHPVSVIFRGKAGSNFFIEGHGGAGYGLPDKDIGAGIGYPVLGDNVSLLMRSMILGPVHIESGATLEAGSVITKDYSLDQVQKIQKVRIMQQSTSKNNENPNECV